MLIKNWKTAVCQEMKIILLSGKPDIGLVKHVSLPALIFHFQDSFALPPQ